MSVTLPRDVPAYTVCPRDHGALRVRGRSLICEQGHEYPYIDGVPVLLVDESDPTHHVLTESWQRAREGVPGNPGSEPGTPGVVDAFVQQAVAATCGILYKPLIGKLRRYPIPQIRLPRGSGKLFLDIGCNWGRWCISAARAGYTVVGIDPSLDAIFAARRVTRQLGLEATYIVGDARALPFRRLTFDVAFSYSVLQHFSKENVSASLAEIARVLQGGGMSLVQMPNQFGVRSLQHQAKRRFQAAKNFEVRYWSPSELRQTFSQKIGSTKLFVDGYFGLGIQESDIDLLQWNHKLVVHASEVLRKISETAPILTGFADSLYVQSVSDRARVAAPGCATVESS